MQQKLNYLFWYILQVGANSKSPVYGSPTSYLLEMMCVNKSALMEHIRMGGSCTGTETVEISLNGAGLKLLVYVGSGGLMAQVAGDQKDLYPEFVDECTTMLKKRGYFPINNQE